MQTSVTPYHWVHANRTSLNTLAEFVHEMPNPMQIHFDANISDCHVTIEPYDAENHADICGLIITDSFVTHVGRALYNDQDVLVSLMFHTVDGLKLMYAALTKHFWNLVDPDIAAFINQIRFHINHINQIALSKAELLPTPCWLIRKTTTPPAHLSHLSLDQTALVIRSFDGDVFGLELANVGADEQGYTIMSATAIRKTSVNGMMEYIKTSLVKRPPTTAVKAPTPRPKPSIDVASLAIVKSIEECLQIDLGRAKYTLELDLKAPLRRTMTVTAPKDKTLAAAAESIYSTCVKIGKDYKRGCSVTVSCFARSVVVTITPTDRVIHI